MAYKDSKGRPSGKNSKPAHANKDGIVSKNAKRKDVKNPEALAAFLGMKKMGKAAFQKKAAASKAAKTPGGK